jgi:hypothetical protein
VVEVGILARRILHEIFRVAARVADHAGLADEYLAQGSESATVKKSKAA